MRIITKTRRRMLLIALLFLCGAAEKVSAALEERFVFETWNKQKVNAYRGSFAVPENRNAKDSRVIHLHYVRLPGAGNESGPPIVYLSGGPGGSGIAAINYRFAMFTEMTRYGDVIALDQRGTGASNQVPRCESRQRVPVLSRITDAEFSRYRREALEECLAYWRQRSVDLTGYNTVESARDLDALRRHLGAQQLVLWGTSYGSHLALTALKEMEGGIARVIVSSAEGLNQTVKLPAQTEIYLARLQEAIDSQPAAKAIYPDVAALIRRVHARLEREPMIVKLRSRDGASVDYLLQRRDMQMLAAGLIADPRGAAQLLEVYLAVDEGVAPTFEFIPQRQLPESLIDPGRPISLEGMPVAMDLASGATAARLAIVREQLRTSILERYLDDTLLLDDVAPGLDLGDGFRAGPASAVPVLVFSGTLDGRTIIESQREAIADLKNATAIAVKNAGHNLFDQPSDRMRSIIEAFMTGKPVRDTTIAVDLPDLAPKHMRRRRDQY